ncbi:enoyl-CoA hydratase/isomerase family protein [Salinicola salarius]|uniref:enoyl-CoA hydratase/isomerase family protein n=1 Tax=Salinicola salarius TaxID=430457 RepID=UPI000B3F85A4|nr:enoyl-CoA hydratase-related protein [Salinicola salarius]
MAEPSLILASTEQGVSHLQLNRPDKKNALTEAMYNELSAKVREADRDETVGAIVLSGAGDCFTTGNDILDFRERVQDPAPRPSAGLDFIEQLMNCETPVIAAVKGLAIGIGTTLLMHCDFVVAARSAIFRTPFVDLGLCPEAASSFLMPLMVGYRKASELLLLGEALDADTALRCDLVNRVVEDEALEATALEMARSLAAKPRESVLLSKALMRRAWAARVKDTLEFERDHFGERLKSEDCQTALARFLERGK